VVFIRREKKAQDVSVEKSEGNNTLRKTRHRWNFNRKSILRNRTDECELDM